MGPQSRDDIAAVINDSDRYCFQLCGEGGNAAPVEASSIIGKDGNVRVCVIETEGAGEC